MKKQLLLKFVPKLFILALLTLFYISCKKDSSSGISSEGTKYSELQSWYNSEKAKSSYGRIPGLKPDWGKFSIIEDNTALVYEIELDNPNKVFLTSEKIDITKAEDYSKLSTFRLILSVDKKTNKIQGAYMNILATNNDEPLQNIHYKKVQKLTGKVQFFNINGTYLNGWVYKNGKIEKKIRPLVIGGAKTEESTCVIIASPIYGTVCAGNGCSSSIIAFDYSMNCGDSFNPDYGEGGGGSGGIGPAPENGGGGGGSSGGGVAPPLVINLDDRMKYPTLANIIDGLYKKVMNTPKLMDALKQFTHLNQQQILESLKPGKGPLVQVVSTNSLMGGSVGEFDTKTGIIKIAESVASDANYFSTSAPTGAEFYLTVCILHEYIHYGENVTQIFRPSDGHANDAGFQYEDRYYGGKVRFNPITGVIDYLPL